MKTIKRTRQTLFVLTPRFALLTLSLSLSLSLSAKYIVTPLTRNAVRIQSSTTTSRLPEWIYVNNSSYTGKTNFNVSETTDGNIIVKNKKGTIVFQSTNISLTPSTIQGEPTNIAELSFQSPLSRTEYQYGLGQFQDGYTNVYGLTRRLTQVNTQISIPMLISSNGYAILWNNYGLTEFNPCSHSVKLRVIENAEHTTEVVNATSTHGNRREVRRSDSFTADINIDSDGDYTLLLDVGQQMARKHWMSLDDKVIIDVNNTWLPPTTSITTHLTKGTHRVVVNGSRGDKPTLYWEKIDNTTTFRSPVAERIDFTIFVGTPDEIISSYRQLTGKASPMPQWALGYIHCRERFHSQDEIITTAKRFISENIPLDVIVQDWQWWGKYGWNAMQFDEQYYPNPKQMMSELHSMDVRLMLSVWSKIDKNCEVGREAKTRGYYIDGTDWIDFFNPKASQYYWKNFREKIIPTDIDCWWQDATEPENDDLVGRKVCNNTIPGEMVRNVYPLMVCQTVYEGALEAGQAQPFILTRSGFPGIQRYGAALWSGDVGNDWETLRRQICGGLGLASTGIPWWTYDAGGFFRPGDQYTNAEYHERMLRWIQTSVFLPLMRVHGYMSNTEPWNYPESVQKNFIEQIRLRHKLIPYIYKEASMVSTDDYTLMRPLFFDFSNDEEALRQDTEYMFGHNLLICPVYQSILPAQTASLRVYLPQNKSGWYDFWTGTRYTGGQYINIPVTIEHIPVFSNNKKLLHSNL